MFIMKYPILLNLGFESMHNLDCWSQKEYLGFGAAAHSYIQGVRRSNESEVEKYINNINSGNFGNNIIIHEKQISESKRKRIYDIRLKKDSRCKHKRI